MFGYIIINKGDMKFKEFDIYHSYYCGLCRVLKEKYGLAGQLSLSYDMTFLIMILSSLYEPDTRLGETKCVAHPFEKHVVRTNEFTEYAADMNVLFTYYKCRDDWEDDKKPSRLAYAELLKKAYRSICSRYGEKARKIDSLLREISQEEKKQNQDIDHMAGIFGNIMGEMMAVREDEWQEELRTMGFYIGKFVYLMDALEDVKKDRKKGSYNLFSEMGDVWEEELQKKIREDMAEMMAEAARAFERLPIVAYAGIIRNILYSGVWCKYAALQKMNRKSLSEEKE